MLNHDSGNTGLAKFGPSRGSDLSCRVVECRDDQKAMASPARHNALECWRGVVFLVSDLGVVMTNSTPEQQAHTLRDQFAMAALTGILTSGSFLSAERMAEIAYKHADAMLHARIPDPPDPLGRDARGASSRMRDYLAMIKQRESAA